MFRNLLETEEAEAEVAADDNKFIKIKDCLIAYASDAQVFANNKTFNFTMTKDTASESDCSNSSAK